MIWSIFEAFLGTYFVVKSLYEIQKAFPGHIRMEVLLKILYVLNDFPKHPTGRHSSFYMFSIDIRGLLDVLKIKVSLKLPIRRKKKKKQLSKAHDAKHSF